MTLHLSIVADVFTHEAQAKHALEALRQAGFGYDQIGIAMHGHEGIDLQSDLENLGVSHEQASYYAQEVKAGHTVVSVRPDGREQEAHEIMRQSGALTEAGSAESQTSGIDKQKAAWDQAVASHQAYLAQQLAANTQEDFHRPRSLRPREERPPVTIDPVQTQKTEPRPAIVTKHTSAAPTMQQEAVTEQKPVTTPTMQQEAVTEQKPVTTSTVQDFAVTEQASSIAPIVQNNATREQLPGAQEEHIETVDADDEETLRRLRKQEPDRAEVLSPQLEKPGNRNMVRNGMLLGGLVLGLGAGVLVALLQREQIHKFVLSTTRTMQRQQRTIRNRINR